MSDKEKDVAELVTVKFSKLWLHFNEFPLLAVSILDLGMNA